MFKEDLVGRVFERLTVQRRVENQKSWGTWACLCSCGKEKIVPGRHLKAGAIRSCGCLNSELSRGRRTTHGQSGSPEHIAFKGMWARCTNPKNPDYEEYQHRCPPEEWKDFEVFFKEMGPKPTPQHSLDRIRNEEGYGPGNCKWSTPVEQARNTRRNVWLEHGGKKMIMTDWAKELNILDSALCVLLKTKSFEQIMQEKDSK